MVKFLQRDTDKHVNLNLLNNGIQQFIIIFEKEDLNYLLNLKEET